MDGTSITLALLTSGFLTAMWLLKRDANTKRSQAYRSGGGSRSSSAFDYDGSGYDVGDLFGGGHHHHHDAGGGCSSGNDSSCDGGGDCGGGGGGD
jgi:hypothetical protein